MAVKTITIDLAAYEILARYKEDGMSFSKVIIEQLVRKTRRDLRQILESLELSDATVDSLDARVKHVGEAGHGLPSCDSPRHFVRTFLRPIRRSSSISPE